jgi:hypothetical protein
MDECGSVEEDQDPQRTVQPMMMMMMMMNRSGVLGVEN